MSEGRTAALLELMATQEGVATVQQAAEAGVPTHRLAHLVRLGVLHRAARGVVVANGAPRTWRQRALVATLAPGRGVLSHGAAARVHGLDPFVGHPHVDVLYRKGARPAPSSDVVTHFTRGPLDDHVTEVDGIPALTVAATLALLAPMVGLEATAGALGSALRRGASPDDLRAVARRWQGRGRPGPACVLRLLEVGAPTGQAPLRPRRR